MSRNEIPVLVHQRLRDATVTHDRRFAERFQTTLDLFATGMAMKRHAIRRARPDASDDEVERLLVAWLHDRPGAEKGDGPQNGE